MNNSSIHQAFATLSTPVMADSCMRLDIPLRLAPPGARPVTPGMRLAGRVLPARHYGSVDVFLEAMHKASDGDVLVVDNGGRTDEGCVGDLTALEAKASWLAGMVVWGFHRDTSDLLAIGFPVFSYGVFPAGPRRLDDREEGALASARFGDLSVTQEDIVVADVDGILFIAAEHIERVIEVASSIQKKERTQAESVESGRTLREQLKFEEFLKRRDEDPGYTFRSHLRQVGGEIEE